MSEVKIIKKVMIHLEDGRIYSLPAHVVADNRAKYYAERDKDTTYQEEYDFAMSENYELIDWLFNNMDWYEHNPTQEKNSQLPELKDADIKETYVRDFKDQ